MYSLIIYNVLFEILRCVHYVHAYICMLYTIHVHVFPFPFLFLSLISLLSLCLPLSLFIPLSLHSSPLFTPSLPPSLSPSLSPSPLYLPPFPLRLSILVCVVYSQYWRKFGRLILSYVIVSWLSFLTYYKGKHQEDSRMNLYSPLVIKWRERNELTNSILFF